MTSSRCSRWSRWSRWTLAAALAVVVTVALSSCAAGPNDAAAVGARAVAGFWPGLWHGMISPVTFLISLFSNSVSIYEVHNNGAWYDFGFVLGCSIAFSGGARSGSAARRRRRRASTPEPT